MENLKRDLEELKEIRELLVVVDMVNGFIKEGALASPSIMRIVPRIQQLVNYYLEKDNGKVAIVRDSHSKDAVEFKTYAPHCIAGTHESELIDELKYVEKDALTYLKNSTNLVFAKNYIEDLINMENLEQIAFVGCLSEVCVENGAITTKNLLDELNRDVEVLVYSDAIDTFNAPNHNRYKITEDALDRMERNGIKIYRRGER